MTGFFRRGVTQFHVLAVEPADLDAPTTTEISAGHNITASVTDVAGWAFANTRIDDPDYASAYVNKIPGPDVADDSSLTIRENKGDATDNPLRATLAKGTEFWMVIAPSGGTGTAGALAAGDTVDVFHCEVASAPREYSSGNDPARWRAEIAVVELPHQDATVA